MFGGFGDEVMNDMMTAGYESPRKGALYDGSNKGPISLLNLVGICWHGEEKPCHKYQVAGE